MFQRLNEHMRSRSAALLSAVDSRLDRILQGWLLIAGLLAAARIAFTSVQPPIAGVSTVAYYLLVVLAPFLSTILALQWFRDAQFEAQPRTRIARVGRWRDVSGIEAMSHHLYGCGGLMVSLLVGMMINVAIRAAEYFAAMPPMPDSMPAWLATLQFAMTMDVVLFGSLYMIAFVAALRCSPLFPRLMVAIWLGDLLMQLVTAKLIADAGGVPPAVALSLQHLLENNVKKVLISVALWLPYLLLSTRVNVTFRRRVPA